MKKKQAALAAAAVALAVLALCAVLVIFKKEDTSQFPRVVILGIDGAGWNVINPMLKEGKLPRFKALMDEGSYGSLQTVKPTKSSVIWTSIATGKSMLKHGIVDWAFVKENGIQVPYTQSERRVKAFWNILSDRGRSVGVINWFVTYPAEKVRGFMVTEAFHDVGRADLSKLAVTYPPSLLKTLEFAAQKNVQKIYQEENLPNYKKADPTGPVRSHYPSYVLQAKTVEVAGLYLLKNRPVEVFATYFHLVDAVSHFIFSGIDPRLLQKGRDEEIKNGRVSAETRDALDLACSRLLEPVYRYIDKILGELLDRLGPDSTIIVCSDHAFIFEGGGYNHYESREIPHGILLIKGPQIKKRHEIKEAGIYDILPTILYRLGLPQAQDMDGKVLTGIFEDDYLRRNPMKFIRTYEDGKKKKTTEGRDSAADQKLLEELKALGYIK
jgi:predicted AlkP superfamily phosphohydrolase/phosphomutase